MMTRLLPPLLFSAVLLAGAPAQFVNMKKVPPLRKSAAVSNGRGATQLKMGPPQKPTKGASKKAPPKGKPVQGGAVANALARNGPVTAKKTPPTAPIQRAK